ncbi:MAG: hypothetical protein B6I28_06375 [Fusobacteriia bacterium 4572_132]|nr:MAG: hypothetical protein B6I28_06375 [Fusobacteriia bacterium 4572_132]
MLALKNHLIAYTDGSADNIKTKKGGYGIYMTFNEHTKTFSKPCKEQTSNNKMEIEAVNNVFINTKNTIYPVLIFMDSDYVYNCAIGNWKRKKNVELWDRFEEITEDFMNRGGKFKFFILESHINIQDSTKVNQAYKKFVSKNTKENIAYLRKITDKSLKYVFTEILKGNHIADGAAYRAKSKAERKIS